MPAALTMLPPAAALPAVLPTERLGLSAKPKSPLRDELRRIPTLHNLWSIVALVATAVGVLWAAARWHHPVGYALAFVTEGCVIVRFNILGHEAVHRLLLPWKPLEDWVGRWVLSYPVFVGFELYRRGHIAHHRDEMGPKEPDLALYRGYPVTRSSLRRKLWRDASGSSGWKLLKALFRGVTKPRSRRVALSILGTQTMILGVLTVLGHPGLYLLWFGPYMTQWRVTNRLRAIAEHGGMTQSQDRRETTHVVRQSLLAKVFMVPFNVGYHLAHHVDMGVPYRNLPKLQRELEASGWVTPALIYPSYRALWWALSSRPEANGGVGATSSF